MVEFPAPLSDVALRSFALFLPPPTQDIHAVCSSRKAQNQASLTRRRRLARGDIGPLQICWRKLGSDSHIPHSWIYLEQTWGQRRTVHGFGDRVSALRASHASKKIYLVAPICTLQSGVAAGHCLARLLAPIFDHRPRATLGFSSHVKFGVRIFVALETYIIIRLSPSNVYL